MRRWMMMSLGAAVAFGATVAMTPTPHADIWGKIQSWFIAAAPAPRSALPETVWPGPSVEPSVTPVAGFGDPWSNALRAAQLRHRDTPSDALAEVLQSASCGPDAIGTSRTVAVSAKGGPHWGRHDSYLPPDFLGPKEVVLTFDDGPRNRTTRQILRTLEEHCAKATFFVIGQMAKWRPEILRETADAGHTIAAHTRSHPIPFDGLSAEAAMAEMEGGVDDVVAALGAPIAPFFRFPGLADTDAMLAELSARDISAFSVDVISDDTSRNATAASIVENTMRRLRWRGNGVLLFHDTLQRTADALPTLLRRLKEEGYKVVHLEPAERIAHARKRPAAPELPVADAATGPAIRVEAGVEIAIETPPADLTTADWRGVGAALPAGAIASSPLLSSFAPTDPSAPATAARSPLGLAPAPLALIGGEPRFERPAWRRIERPSFDPIY